MRLPPLFRVSFAVSFAGGDAGEARAQAFEVDHPPATMMLVFSTLDGRFDYHAVEAAQCR